MLILKTLGRPFTTKEIATGAKILVELQPAIDKINKMIKDNEFESPMVFGELFGSIMLYILSNLSEENCSDKNVLIFHSFMQFLTYVKNQGLLGVMEIKKDQIEKIEKESQDAFFDELLKKAIKE